MKILVMGCADDDGAILPVVKPVQASHPGRS